MRPVHRRAAVAAMVLLTAVSAACAAPPTAPTTSPAGAMIELDPRTQLALAEQRWAERGPRNYDYTVSVGCFCFWLPRSVRFEVRDGVSRAPDADATTVQRFAWVSRVDLMFADIRRTLDRNPYRFVADYHPVTGHPTQYWADIDLRLQDEEYGVSITDFVAR